MLVSILKRFASKFFLVLKTPFGINLDLKKRAITGLLFVNYLGRGAAHWISQIFEYLYLSNFFSINIDIYISSMPRYSYRIRF